MGFEDLTVIIPTLNEEKNIRILIRLLKKYYKDATIIVADDGSKDKTQEIINEEHRKDSNIILIDRAHKEVKGLTASVMDAILAAKTKYFVVIDGDLQHPPESIKDIFRELQDNDLVVGTRKKVASDWPLVRRLMSWGATFLGRLRLVFKGFNCRDIMSGFFGARTSLAKSLIRSNYYRFYPEGYKILFDLLKVMPRGSRIGTVNYVFGARKAGSSKISAKHIKIYLKSLLR